MGVAVTLTEWLNWVSNEGSGERKILALASGKKRSPGHKRANDILALKIINFLSRAMKADNSSAAALPLSARSFVQLSVSQKSAKKDIFQNGWDSPEFQGWSQPLSLEHYRQLIFFGRAWFRHWILRDIWEHEPEEGKRKTALSLIFC